MKKKPAKKRAAKTARKPAVPHVYREPKTAKELGITCSVCGDDASWFDYRRGKRDHRAGFICGKEQRSAQSEKLLVRQEPARGEL